MRSKNQGALTKVQKKAVDTFWDAAQSADQHKKSLDFLRTLLTESEQLLLGRRLRIAHMLLEHKTRTEIVSLLRVSPNTISKVHRWLGEEMPEYGMITAKMAKESESRNGKRKRDKSWYKKDDNLPFSQLRKRYPLHFLLFNITADFLDTHE